MSRFSPILQKILIDLAWKYIKDPSQAPKGRKVEQTSRGKWRYETKPRGKKTETSKPSEKKIPAPVQNTTSVPLDTIFTEFEIPHKLGKIVLRKESLSGEPLIKPIRTKDGTIYPAVNDGVRWIGYWVGNDGSCRRCNTDWEGVSPKSFQYNVENRNVPKQIFGERITEVQNITRFLNAITHPYTGTLSAPPNEYPIEDTEDTIYESRWKNDFPGWENDEMPLIERITTHEGDRYRVSSTTKIRIKQVSTKKYQLVLVEGDHEDVLKESMAKSAKKDLMHLGGTQLTPGITKLLKESYKLTEQQKAERKLQPKVKKDTSHLTLFKTAREGVEFIKKKCKTVIQDYENTSPESLHAVASFLTKAETIFGKALPGGFAFGGPRGRVVAHFDHNTKCIHVKKGAEWANESDSRHKRNYTDYIDKGEVPHNVDMTNEGLLWHEFGHQFDTVVCKNTLAGYIRDHQYRGPGGWDASVWAEFNKLSVYSRRNLDERLAESMCAIMMKSDRRKYIPKDLIDLIISKMEENGVNMEEYKYDNI